MQEHYTPKGKHLTIDNRRLIERWKNENKSNREIAGLLGKALSLLLIPAEAFSFSSSLVVSEPQRGNVKS
ncbi:transposase-like protein, IS1239 [Streptococcus pneumoniae]|nr:transposase-like protein, IS1239 [Streptococcus pneumoniae]